MKYLTTAGPDVERGTAPAYGCSVTSSEHHAVLDNRRDPVTAQVLELFWAASQAFYDNYDEAAARHDLTRMQAFVLANLMSGPKPMRFLAEHLKCEPSNITGLVDRMQARGLVTREPDPEDRRVKRITATELGRASFDAVWAGLTFAAEPLAGLSGAERETLRDLLARVVPNAQAAE
ncbi:MarR family winged helix-turn-helix transcriptional regulator [Catenulispora pinisilvae]|uniref:MarR family winged helix-turn-helix transcriptional regulator n=1 Tax=Catenulispora pinisilvae TaxID=2705253 RepID=UPI001891AF49